MPLGREHDNVKDYQRETARQEENDRSDDKELKDNKKKVKYQSIKQSRENKRKLMDEITDPPEDHLDEWSATPAIED